ncbi:hypothetical protein Ocin01_00305 [Orchesella cincta]|uniref:Uncharacterized protein n=1 Tax=Orchesella cincta TaxID=48709 RepID=A0A1D2NMA3_ORCCI|nr:hypothetical protein Ocin01_00305 [Orchesella cincta]
MTRIEHFVERRIKVIHPGYFPTIPVLFPESRRDMGWSDCRKNMFYAYIGISFLFTWTAMFHLSIRQQPRGCSFGEMTCKAALGCSRVGLALCKKLKYNNCEG